MGPAKYDKNGKKIEEESAASQIWSGYNRTMSERRAAAELSSKNSAAKMLGAKKKEDEKKKR